MDSSYWQARSVNYHSLQIAETYAIIHEHLNDQIKLVRFETEPDCHIKINYVPINPDMFIELALDAKRRLRAWIEVDLGTERPRQLKDKLDRYHKALQGAGGTKWERFPLVWWVVPDQARQRELVSIIDEQPADSKAMYRIATMDQVGLLLA